MAPTATDRETADFVTASDPAGGFDSLRSGEATVVGSPRHWFHVYFPTAPYREDLDILVVGRGSDQAVQLALTNPASRITALDTRPDRIERLNRERERHGLTNLETADLPIGEAGSDGPRFDLIFSNGELCYLPDPARGLRALRSALRPTGSIVLQMFGRHGRHGIHMLRGLVERLTGSAEPPDTATTRRILEQLAQGDVHGTAGGQLRAWAAEPAMVDALLEPREHAFDFGGLCRLLEDSGLEMQRPFYQAHYNPRCTFLAKSPEIFAKIGSLSPVEQAGIVELYRGGMPMHELIVCRDERPALTRELGYEAARVPEAVPIRNPGLTIVEEGLAAGLSARLSWDAHHYPEISALVDPLQGALFNAIDGVSSVTDIATSLGASATDGDIVEFASNFFRSLWELDYCWFRSRAAGADADPLPSKLLV